MFGGNRWAKHLEGELERERSLNSQFNQCLDEVLDVAQQQRELIAKQRDVIERYERLIETKVRPQLEGIREWCRGQQQGDDQC